MGKIITYANSLKKPTYSRLSTIKKVQQRKQKEQKRNRLEIDVTIFFFLFSAARHNLWGTETC